MRLLPTETTRTLVASLSWLFLATWSTSTRAQPAEEPADPPPAENPPAPEEEPVDRERLAEELAPVADPDRPGPAFPGDEAQSPEANADADSEDIPLIQAETTEEKKLPVELQRDAGVKYRSDGDDNSVSVERLMHSEVVSASKSAESSRTAPARIITITEQDIRERGYTELGQILDDLPAMDVVRAYGPAYQRAYVRGYRSYPGENYLLMVDGVQYNQLYLNDAQMLVSFPVSNVHRVEIVYGPASVVYGANAAAGVINVITCRPTTKKSPISGKNCNHKPPGPSMRGIGSLEYPTGGANFGQMMKTVDGSFTYHENLLGQDVLFSFTGRTSYGSLDPSVSNGFEYTKERYLQDETLWGDYVVNTENAGTFDPRIEQLGLDGRIYFGGLEIAGQMYRLSTGQGLMWAGDRAQANSPWTTAERSVYARYSHAFSRYFDSFTMFRWRSSNVEEPSTFLWRGATPDVDYLPDPTPDGRRPSLSHWRSTNHSFIANQEFGVRIRRGAIPGPDGAKISFGFRYERRNYDKDWIAFNPWDAYAAPLSTGAPNGFGRPIDGAIYPENRLREDRIGGYVLGRYEFIKDNLAHLGARVDYNETLDQTVPSLRVGYVGTFAPITLKALYGQAFQEPTPRQIFGAFAPGSAAETQVEAERSQTIELNVELVQRLYGLSAGGYLINYNNPIITTSATAENLETRNIVGLDFGAFGVLPLGSSGSLKGWSFYSPIVLAEESAPNGAAGTVPIGDIAKHKVLFGATLGFSRFSITTLGRWIGSRDPVASNPLGPLRAYTVIDANIRVNATKGLYLALRGENLLNANVQHPGLSTAGSGNAPGFYDDAGNWNGSVGLFNSRLPQPGRSLLMILELDLESKADKTTN